MTDDAKLVESDEELEHVLAELQEIETFEPPTGFRDGARITDEGVYEAAERDPEAYWAEQARQLHWDQPFTTVLDDS
ncbi:MAG: acetyl-coenzyme A synthetase, partial [Sporichthyaceae bacterium]|nr:acetyl-coenzyme A synthetase [Sporichthyaceae bacterium]